MRGSVVLAGAILGSVALVGVPAQGGASAPDPYSGSIETECSISVPAVVEPGERVVIRVSVDANSPAPPTGKIAVSISEKPSGDVVWDKTVNYNGGTKRIVGPVLARDHRYVALARFFPDDKTFTRCRASEAFAVDSTDDGPGPDGENPDGTLPDTGGPAMLWLLLGLGLVGGGSATVAYARRRTSPALA